MVYGMRIRICLRSQQTFLGGLGIAHDIGWLDKSCKIYQKFCIFSDPDFYILAVRARDVRLES